MDETGSKAAIRMHAPIGTTYAQMDASAGALASIVAPITGCVLVSQRIVYKTVQAPRDAPHTGSAIKRQGVFIYENEDGTEQALVAVPGIRSGLLTTLGPGAGVLIDTDNADVSAFIELYIGGMWVNPFGDDMVRLVAAYRQSRA